MEEPMRGPRREWLGILAKSDPALLEIIWTGLESHPGFTHLRSPETGLAMVQGRIGGTGAPFNIGEMSMTRCSVRLDSGGIGHGYVAGRNRRHAELVALMDALFQEPDAGPRHQQTVLPELRKQLQSTREQQQKRTAATRVDFFTMVRGED